MPVSSPTDDSAISKSIECSSLLTAPVTRSAEQVEEVLPESTAGRIESEPSAIPLLSSATTNQTWNPAAIEAVAERASTPKRLFKIYGIAAGMIVMAGISAWNLQGAGRRRATDNYKLGVAYENGRNVAKDDAKAAFWYRKAADQGNAAAQNKIGVMYFNGQAVQKSDSQAVFWFRKAAEQGNADAQYSVGWMYMNGRGGLAKDEAQAVSWYRKAAEQGNTEAQNNLGVMYQYGQGVLSDDTKAASWYRKAAEQGDASGQHNLAGVYDEGKGVPKDEAEAVRWWRKSAEQGNAESQYNLGMMYEHGEGGLAEDDTQAVSWYQKAADRGYLHATVALDRLKQDRENAERQRTSEDGPTARRKELLYCKSSVPLKDGRILEAEIMTHVNTLGLALMAFESVSGRMLWEGNFQKDSSGIWVSYFAPPHQTEVSAELLLPDDRMSWGLKINSPTVEGSSFVERYASGTCSTTSQ